MRIEFVEHASGPERLVCDAEIHFDEPGLEGFKLCGFSLWKGADGEVYVTYPSRAFGVGSERRYFDFLRTVDSPGTESGSQRHRDFKAGILAAYGTARAAGTVRQ